MRLRVTDLVVPGAEGRPAVEHASFDIHAGEILGVAGVEGNGQFELCTALLGLRTSSGQIEVDGRDVTRSGTRARHEAGLAYIPFDRHREGLMLNAPLWENTLLGRENDPALATGPLINIQAARTSTVGIIERFGVLTPDETTPAFALSGGNQQKLVVGRAMITEPAVLVAAHPTCGIDVGAQAAVWDEIRRARDAGMAVLLVSADLEELIGLSDRIAVMFDGRVTAMLDPDTTTPAELGGHMTGSHLGAPR